MSDTPIVVGPAKFAARLNAETITAQQQEIHSLRSQLAISQKWHLECEEVLKDCEEFFEKNADSWTEGQNAEMRLLMAVREALYGRGVKP